MSKYLAAYSPKQVKGKTYWTRIGVAFPTKNGGLSVTLDALPASDDGKYKICLFKPKEKPAGQQNAILN